ncbi:MAG: AAA family ATPase, partial [Pseudomonadota bacterium]
LAAQLERDVAARQNGPQRDVIAAWAAETAGLIGAHGAQLDARGRHGFVRHCHGDLHLSNLCLLDGVPTPFDALEFSDEIATIDVLYDLAFVLVDLEHRGLSHLSMRLLSRYLEWTRDYAGLSLLPLFMGLRSMVRALVALSKGRPADALIAAAYEAVSAPRTPFLVAVGGLSGTGKTTVARALAHPLRAVIVRSDSARKHLAGVAPEAPLPKEAYTPQSTADVYRRLRVDARRALRAGWPVILDATFLARSERDAVAAVAHSAGVPFRGIWLEAPGDVLRERVGERVGDASDADAAVVNAQQARDPGPIDWSRYGAARDAATLAETIVRDLRLPTRSDAATVSLPSRAGSSG